MPDVDECSLLHYSLIISERFGMLRTACTSTPLDGWFTVCYGHRRRLPVDELYSGISTWYQLA